MEIVLIAHDIRSTHNVGSLARSADGFGVNTIYCTGYTPYIQADPDERLPHIRTKLERDIHKTALGAEKSVCLTHHPDINTLIKDLRREGFTVCGLEQSKNSTPLNDFPKSSKLALILGAEVTGIPADIQAACDELLEIPMRGTKESFNVSVAGAIAMYELRRPTLY